MTNRYNQFLALSPFKAAGHVLPYKTSPYTFQFAPVTALRPFGVYVNNSYVGEVTSDASGAATVTVTLEKGSDNIGTNEILVIDSVTGDKFTSTVTVRTSATWHAAYADVIEALDQDVEDINSARSLRTVPVTYAEDVYGRSLRTPNTGNYILDSYRNVLEDVRQGYRHYAGTPRGLRSILGAFTSVSPFTVNDLWLPQFIPDFRLMPSIQVHTRTTSAQWALAGSSDDLAANVISLTYIHGTILDSALSNVFSNPFSQPPVPQKLTVTFESGWSGGAVTITGTNDFGVSVSEDVAYSAGTVETFYTYSAITSASKAAAAGSGKTCSLGTAISRFITINSLTDYASLIAHQFDYTNADTSLQYASGDLQDVSVSGTYTIYAQDPLAYLSGLKTSAFNLDPLTSANQCDRLSELYFDIDKRGFVRVPLGTGTTITAASTVTAINTVLGADARYAGYGAVATSKTGTQGIATICVQIQSLFHGEEASISLPIGPSTANYQVFGLPHSHTFTTATVAHAATGATVSSTSLFPAITTADTSATYVNSSVPGVTLNAVTVPLGIGTLAYTVSTKTLRWTAPGESAGAAVAVGAGGDFTLLSSSLTHTLNVSVVAANLATSNVSVSVEVSDSSQYSVRIYGRRAATQTNGVISAVSAYTCTFTSASNTFYADDIGSWVRISGSSNNNDGCHEIIGYTSAHVVTLRFDQTNAALALNATFTNESSLKHVIYGIGEILKVTSTTGTTFAFSTAVALAWPSSSTTYIELANEVPWTETAAHHTDGLTVTVNPDFAPGMDVLSTITPQGVNTPDFWATNASTIYEGYPTPGRFEPVRTVLTGTGTTVNAELMLYMSVSCPRALQFKGLSLIAAFWIGEHSESSASFRIDVSSDGGSTWDTSGGSTSVTGQLLRVQSGGVYGPLNPTLIARTFYVPYNATDLRVRLTRLVSSGTITISIEDAQLTHSSITVARSDRNNYFRDVIYLWSPDALTTPEDKLLGVVDDSDNSHINLLMPPHTVHVLSDLSEYDGSGEKINVVGSYNESEWLDSTLTNMDVVVGTPPRLSCVIPSRISRIEGETLTETSPGIFALVQTSNQDGDPNGETVLSQNDVPIPDTEDSASVQPYTFTAANELSVDPAYYISGQTYALDYSVLMRAATSVFALPTDYTEYVWLTDCAYFNRVNTSLVASTRSQQVQFNASLQATLSNRTDMDKSSASLVADDGFTQTNVTTSQWSFIDSQTVKLNPGNFNSNALYTLTYNALLPSLSNLTVLIEHRMGTDEAACLATDWETVHIGVPVSPVDVSGTYYQYHQMRITINGVEDTRDVRIYGLGLKGIHLFGSSPVAPGII